MLKQELRALAVAVRDPRTPRAAKILGACVVAYAVSPIDLIPDPIPVLGYLDDVILLPIGIWLVVRLIPEEVLEEARASAAELQPGRSGRIAAAVVLLLWVATAVLVAWLGFAVAS